MESTAPSRDTPTAAPSEPSAPTPSDSARTQVLQAVLIAAAAVSLILGCWNAGFTTYDDSVHVFANKRLASSATELILPTGNRTYFPVTEFSYQLDRVLFAKWLPTYLHTWAPGIRFMTLLYHIGAALVLLRVLRLLQLGASAAFLIALIFSCHPLACETVCWVSERKNALAALFGFASLWAWLRFDGRLLRMPLVILFYLLALLSKPSVLGLLPVFLFLELFNAPAGLLDRGKMYFRPSREWLTIFERLASIAALALVSLLINLRAHASTLQPPPGGTVFTALLTDLEILARYLYNLAIPIHLSAAYFVEPVRTISDPRVFIYGTVLLALAAITIALSVRRNYTLLGWLWFVGALGPNLNLIAIPHIMQDRYIYLSTPGLFLVIVETVSGMLARLRSARFDLAAQRRVLRIACGAYVAMLIALAGGRSSVWHTTFSVFKDAVEKQPQSTFAHYGLGNGYVQAWQMEKTSPPLAEEYRRQYLNEWRVALACPDAMRFTTYIGMARIVGDDAYSRGDMQAAESYWKLCATAPTETFDNPPERAKALVSLALLQFAQERFEESLASANGAARLDLLGGRAVVMRAKAALALAEKKQREGDARLTRFLLDNARQDLRAISPDAPFYDEVQKLLNHRLLAEPQ